MADDNEEILKANAGARTADIPDLRKKKEEDERKKAGAAWSGARSAAGASRSVISAGAGAGGGVWANVARMMAQMTATLAGKLAVAAVALLMASGVGMAGYSLLKGGGAGGAGGAGGGGSDLGGIKDTMKIHEGGADRLRVASNGELAFAHPGAAAQKAAAPAAAEKGAASAAGAAGAPEEAAAPDTGNQMQNALAHNLSGAKLSGSVGGNFGKKDIFGGGGPKFDAGLSKVNVPKMNSGKLASMAGGNVNTHASSRSVIRGSSTKGFGQLKLANKMSFQGATAPTAEAAASAAQGAFDQQAVDGGALTGPGAPPDAMPTVTPTANPGSPPEGTPTPGGVDPTVKNMMDQITALDAASQQDLKKGQQDIMIGSGMVALGLVCLAIAMGLLSNPWTAVAGWAWYLMGSLLVTGGGAMIYQGVSLENKSKREAQQAGQLGSQLGATLHNDQQTNAINYCLQQAQAGVPPDQCVVPDSITYTNADQSLTQQEIQQVQNEENATFSGGN